MKKKILHLIPYLTQGGAETLLINWVNNQTRRHTHQIITFLDKNDQEYLKSANAEVSNMLFRNPIEMMCNLKKIHKKIDQSNCDIVVCWLYQSTALSPLIIPNGIPSISYIHNTTLHKTASLNERLSKNISKWVSKLSQINMLYCAKSAEIHHKEIGYTAKSSTVIQNGIDVGKFIPNLKEKNTIRREYGIADDTFVFGYFGRFAPQKNLPLTLKCIANAQKSGNVHLLAAGNGLTIENSAWRGLLEQYGLTNSNTSLGIRGDIDQLIPACDATLLTSSYGEALSLSVLEAMACEVPPITTDIGDNKFVLSGFMDVASIGDENALLATTNRLVAMDSAERRRLGERLRVHVLENYNWELVVKKLDEYVAQTADIQSS